MNVSSILIDRFQRPRSGWRFAIFVLAFALMGTVIGSAAVFLTAFSIPIKLGTAGYLVVNGIAALAVSLLVGWLCGRFFEKLPFRALGASPAHGWLKNLTLGFVIGGLTLAAAALIGMTGGGLWFRLNADASLYATFSTLAASFAIFAAAAAFEEALFRGYILQTFIRSDLTLFAVLLTAAIFATVHNANPNATRLSWLNTFVAGLWFAVAYLRTRDLWLPFGLHLAWNWTQGAIFGVEVSGLTEIVKAPVLRESDSGPAWLTGGDYGLEGGVACTIALILSCVVIHVAPMLRADPEMLSLTSSPYRTAQPDIPSSIT
jgi:membrane protease YdiL (CAAX protease family)